MYFYFLKLYRKCLKNQLDLTRAPEEAVSSNEAVDC